MRVAGTRTALPRSAHQAKPAAAEVLPAASHWSAAALTAKHAPTNSISHPTGWRGKLTATNTPATANSSG